MRHEQSLRRWVRLFSLGLVTLWTAIGPVRAQEAVAQQGQAGEGAGTMDEIVVTASRIARDGFSAPTPTTTISIDEIRAAGAGNIAEVVNQLPSVRPSMTPSSTTNLSGFAGGNFIDLRGLGFNRTLVLVDGKRYVPTQVEGPVDINVIPQALIQSVEVVTGGASAAWGADAVAGVVNFRFDRNFEGFNGLAQGGVTSHGDREETLVSVAIGNSFSDGRGHILVGAETANRNGIRSLADRDWGAQDWVRIANPAFTPTNDEPRMLLVPNVTFANQSFGGLINAGPLAGIQFDTNGTPVPFTYGDLRTTSTMVGGDGPRSSGTQTLEAPLDRHSLYGRLDYGLTSSVTAYGEASWAKSDTKYGGLVRQDTALTIQRDNPFLPESIGEAMDQLGLGSFRMGRFNRDYGQVINDKWTESWQVAAGLEGEFAGGWSWDVYYSRGRSETELRQLNNRIIANFNNALDATTDPVTGAAVCRNPEARAAGCKPINLFGEGAPSQESLAYVMGSSQTNNIITQDNLAAMLQGTLWSLPAGDVSVAAGLEWRRLEAEVRSDPLSAAASFATGNTVPWDGAVEVTELFVETVLPIVSGHKWAQILDLNMAARLTDYSTSGRVDSWKVGSVWQANDLLRFRVTQSRDIRAPTLAELFQGSVTSVFNVFDPELHSTYSVQSIRSGFVGLVPEEANTTTLGIVLTPGRNLSVSLDYYKIDVDKAITTFQAADIVDRCHGAQPELCRLIVRDATTGQITRVNVAPQNLQSMEVSGADLELAYLVPVHAGQLGLRALVSYIDKLRLDDGQVVLDMAGSTAQPTIASIGGQPHWSGKLSASYGVGPYTANLAVRYVGGGRLDNTFTEKDINVLKHSGRSYFDLGGVWELPTGGRGDMALFLTVRNLLDRDPPINGVGGFGTTRSLYDVIGRTYVAGVRFGF